MYYRQISQPELTQAQIESARIAFRGKLVNLKYPPEFIVRHCDELLAVGHSAYVQAAARGEKIQDPAAFAVHVAWQRLKNVLRYENYRAGNISAEAVAEILDSGEASPEEATLASERVRAIRDAVAELSEDQRKVIALTYFEEYSVREAARYLDWSPGRVQHHQRSALALLRRVLPVDSSDELAVDVGMAAWLSLAGASMFHLPAGFEALLDKAGHGVSGLWARAHDLARRFSIGGGNDAATAVASSGAGRTAGACATGLLVVCVAGFSGAVPGVGVNVFGHSGGHIADHHAKRSPREPAAGADRAAASTVVGEAPLESTESSASKKRPASRAGSASGATERTSTTSETKRKTELRQVEEQTSGIAKAGADASTDSGSGASSSGGSGSAEVTVPAPSTAAAKETPAPQEFQPALHPAP